MGLNRMMMKSNKDITAEMVVGYSGRWIGFLDGSFGELLPNPLPNGVRVSAVTVSPSYPAQLLPATIKSCTFEKVGVTLKHGDMDEDNIPVVGVYLGDNMGSRVPITFHF